MNVHENRCSIQTLTAQLFRPYTYIYPSIACNTFNAAFSKSEIQLEKHTKKNSAKEKNKAEEKIEERR